MSKLDKYVDGYVVPVPKAKLEDYRKMAELASTVWRDHGALEYYECVEDDVKPGKLTSFPQSVQLKDDEVVIFAWIVFKSRAHRDEVNAKVMEDKRLSEYMTPDTVPFDMKRMFFGGFKPIVAL